MATVQLDKERHIRLDLNAMIRFEEMTGKPFTSLANMTAKDMRVLIWAALVHEDPGLTIERVGEMITAKELKVVAAALIGEQRKGNEAGPLPAPGHGPRSTRTSPQKSSGA